MPYPVAAARGKIFGKPFLPTDISGLKLWLDASDAATLFQDVAKATPAVSDGDVIGAWADKSGNGNDATQGTTTQKPILKLAQQNGRNIVQFDGVDDYLSITEITTIRTIFWVFKNNETGEEYRFVLGHSNLYHFHPNPNPPCWSDSTNADVNYRDGTLYVNGNTIGTPVDYPLPSAMSICAVITVGNCSADRITRDRGWPSRSWYGPIGELLIYDLALSIPQRQAIESYLNQKWATF